MFTDIAVAKKKKKIKIRIGLILFLVLFAVIAAIGIKLYIEAKDMYRDAKTAKNEAMEILTAVKEERYEDAQAKADHVQSIIKKFRKILDEDPFWKHLDKVPRYGSDVTYGKRILEIADNLMDEYMADGFELLKKYPLSTLKVEQSFNVKAGIEYLEFAQEIIPKAEEIVEEVSRMYIILDKNDMVQKYTSKARELFDLYHDVEKYIPLLKAILGNGEDRYYLLVAQNSAEIRACGGFPGAIGVVKIRDSYLSIGDFNSVWNVLSLNLPDESLISDQERYMFWQWMEYPRDASYDPYYPIVAKIWAYSYSERMGVHVDGVISMTPIIIQKILACTSPITLSNGKVLDGTNATKYIQSDIYWDYLNGDIVSRGDALEYDAMCDALFSETASKTMSSVFDSLNKESIPNLVNMVDEGIEERIIMIWLRNSEGEQVVRQLGASGEFNRDASNPQLGVFFSNSNPSKMGWYLDLDTNVSEPTILPNGAFQYTVSVSMTNTITWDDAYYAGQYIGGTTAQGYLISYLHIAAPAGGYISNYWIDNGYWLDEDMYMGSQVIYCRYFYLEPQQTVTAYFNVTTAVGVDKLLDVVTTPTLQGYR